MSDSLPDIAGLLAQASQTNLAYRVTVSGTALVLYDYALTFSTEVSEIWKAKFTGAQGLFFLTRYSFMLYTVSFCAGSLMQNPSEAFCRTFFVLRSVWNIVPQIGLYGILTLRTYAIYQKNGFVLVILGLPSLAAVTVGVYLEVIPKPEVDAGIFGNICGIDPPSIFARLQLASVILSIMIDVLVFTLTFAKTIHHAIEMRKVGLGNGLGYFILRDGAMYFLAKLLIGVAGTTIFFLPASSAISGSWISALIAIGNPLTIILINRLVLNLRQVSHLQEGANAPTLGTFGTIEEPAFATNSLLGNLGAPLRVGQEDDDDDEEIEVVGVEDGDKIVEERTIANHTEIIEEPRHPFEV